MQVTASAGALKSWTVLLRSQSKTRAFHDED